MKGGLMVFPSVNSCETLSELKGYLTNLNKNKPKLNQTLP
jgi:hypothetical protein